MQDLCKCCRTCCKCYRSCDVGVNAVTTDGDIGIIKVLHHITSRHVSDFSSWQAVNIISQWLHCAVLCVHLIIAFCVSSPHLYSASPGWTVADRAPRRPVRPGHFKLHISANPHTTLTTADRRTHCNDHLTSDQRVRDRPTSGHYVTRTHTQSNILVQLPTTPLHHSAMTLARSIILK